MRFDKGHFEEEKLDKGVDLKFLLKLWPFVRPYGKWIFVSVFLALAVSALEIATPLITRYALDHYIEPASTAGGAFQSEKALTGIMLAAGLLLFSSLLVFITGFAQIQTMEYGGQRILHELRVSLYTHMQGLPVDFFSKNPVGRLVTRVTSDIDNMLEMFTTVLVFFFKDIFLMVGIIVTMGLINLKLACATFIILPFVIAASKYFGSKTRAISRRLRTKTAQLNTTVAETLAGAAVIKSFRQEEYSRANFDTLNHSAYLDGMKEIRVFGIFMPVIEFLSSFALAVIIFYGGLAVQNEDITIGSLVAYISYLRMFFRPVRDMTEKYNVTQTALASAERIFQILDAGAAENHDGRHGRKTDSPPSKSLDTKDGMERNKINHADEKAFESLEFKDVWFAYEPGTYAVKNINLELEKGKTMAAVGHTGAGKTTVINLILRFHEPEKGEILINGQNISEIPVDEVRRRIALVTQDPFIFSGSVRDNVTCLKNNLDSEKITTILGAAQCLDFVNNLPEGMDTLLGEGGVRLSSGQRQLLSIARAIAADPEIIILDEATSYVDSETETRVRLALGNLSSGRTTITIAHRISTAMNADEIMVFHKGEIVEKGTHDELMKKKSYYWKLSMLEGIKK